MIGVITPLETCSEAKEVLDDDDEDVGEVVRQAQVGCSVSVVPAQPDGEFRAMAGSIEGPRRVLDPMRVNLCVPRVP